MEIESIKKENYYYIVSLTPNLIERLFNVKPRIEKYKYTGSDYLLWGENGIYVNEKGEKTGNMSKIACKLDVFRFKF